MARKGTWKRQVLQRANWLCAYCKCVLQSKYPRRGDYGTIDHVIPLSRGGMSIDENTVASCLDCNRKKGNRTADEFAARTAPNTKEQRDG